VDDLWALAEHASGDVKDQIMPDEFLPKGGREELVDIGQFIQRELQEHPSSVSATIITG
jgi:hypothetical protein